MLQTNRGDAKRAPTKKPIPFEFVIEELQKLQPTMRPMFGCQSLYVGEKIILILREKDTNTHDNGIWVATTKEHHESLRKDFPQLRNITIFGDGPTDWQVLPSEEGDFESDALRLCAFILRRDPRIGKIPNSKKKKKAAPAKKTPPSKTKKK